jgi:alpha-L-fucosidase 2
VKPTRREFLRGGLALAALASKAQAALAADPASPHTLWYTSEAKRWLEALPIGNGRIEAGRKTRLTERAFFLKRT